MPIHVDIFARIHERTLKKQTDDLANTFDRTGALAADKFNTGLERGLARSSPKIQRAFHSIADAQMRVNEEMDRYIKLQNSGQASSADLTRQSERIASARRKEADAHRASSSALRSFNDEAQRSMSSFKQMNKDIQETGQNAFRTSRGLAVMASPAAILGIITLAKVAATASQSILLLPAAATAAGAGIGTLQLATEGFGQAIKDIRDPEKFAEALQPLSHNARQAALGIKSLLPQFDALKNATQDQFFAGLSDQLQNLTRIYLPSVEKMTTGIADAFNTMMQDIGSQLATPETQGQIKNTMDNIVQGFNNAAPAAQKFSQAFVDIAEVGSTFLPGLGSDITNVATQFAGFIREARESGKLREWIQEGIDAVKAIASELGKLSAAIFKIFAEDGPENIRVFKENMDGINRLVQAMSGNFDPLRERWAGVFRGIGEDVQNLMVTPINNAMHDIAQAVNFFIDDYNRSIAAKVFGPMERMGEHTVGPSPGTGPGRTTVGGGEYHPPGSGPGSGGGQYTPGGPRGGSGQATVPPGQIFPEPGVPPGGFGASDKERRDAIIAGLDPSLWRVDPYAGIPGGPPMGAPGTGAPGMGAPGMGAGGFGVVDPQKVWEENIDVLRKAHDLEESKKDLLARQRDGVSSAEEINDAQWKVTNDQWDLQKAQADLAEAQRGTTKKLKDSFGEMGAALDDDLGISKGLPGIADNIVRFLGNLAAAPLMGQLNAIVGANQAANPNIQGGSGLIGMWGAQNLARTGDVLGRPGGGGGGGGTGGTGGSGTGGGGGAPSIGQAILGQAGVGGGSPSTATTGGPTAPSAYAGGGGGGGTLASTMYQDANGRWHSSNAAWEHLIQRESSGNLTVPNLTDSNAQAGDPSRGLFQFTTATWLRSGGGKYAQRADLASAQQQAEIAGNLIRMNPSGSDWGAGIPGRENAGALVAGAGAPSPTPAQQTTGGSTAPSLYSPSQASAAVNAADQAILGNAGAPAGFAGFGRLSKQRSEQQAFRHHQRPYDPNQPTGGGNINPAYQIDTSMAGVAPPIVGPNPYAPNRPTGGGGFQPGFVGGGGGDTPGPFPLPPGAPALPYDPKGRVPQGPPGPFGLPAPGSIPSIGSAGTTGGMPPGVPGGPFMGPAGGNPTTIGGSYGGAGNMPNVGSAAGGGGGLGSILSSAGGANPSRIGGQAPIAPNAGGGGVGIQSGGTVDTALGIAASGLDIIAPGAGIAAQIGIKEASRAIQYAGQVAGIGISGLMETFLPTGGSELANNNWLTRIAGGIAGAAPALPNIAGGSGQQAQGNGQPPVAPGDVSTGQGTGPAPGPTIGEVNINNSRDSGDGVARDLDSHLRASYAAPAAPFGR